MLEPEVIQDESGLHYRLSRILKSCQRLYIVNITTNKVRPGNSASVLYADVCGDAGGIKLTLRISYVVSTGFLSFSHLSHQAAPFNAGDHCAAWSDISDRLKALDALCVQAGKQVQELESLFSIVFNAKTSVGIVVENVAGDSSYQAAWHATARQDVRQDPLTGLAMYDQLAASALDLNSLDARKSAILRALDGRGA